MISPREPCLYVKLFPEAVTLAAMAMGMGIMPIFSVVGSLVCGAYGFIEFLGVYVEKMMVIVQSVCGFASFSLCPPVYLSSWKGHTACNDENSSENFRLFSDFYQMYISFLS